MTDRATIIAKIHETIARLIAVEGIPPTALLSMHIDSLDVVEVAITLEDELGLPMGSLDPADDWTIDRIADAVIAVKGKL